MMANNSTYIKEIFESIQGEGPYIGYNQLFVRFSKCNLNCKYCDTDFTSDLIEYTPQQLALEIDKYKNIHSISLTGGEPLLDVEFLQEFLPLINKKIFLETNGTLYNNVVKIIDFVDIISMDIKLASCSQNINLFDLHEKFIKNCGQNKKIYAKVVFDTNITENEINATVSLVKTYNIPIILQPKMDGDVLNLHSDFIKEIFYKFVNKYQNTRLIPQVHKFINVR